MPLDRYLQERVFAPLDIQNAFWMKDRQGDPLGAGELFLRPIDLVKLGLMVADGGRWQGKQIVPEGWLQESFRPGQAYNESCGYLWWRMVETHQMSTVLTPETLEYWKHHGLSESEIGKLQPLLGQLMDSGDGLEKLQQVLGKDRWAQLDRKCQQERSHPFVRRAHGPAQAFSAIGYLGQYLVIIPERKIVAVRMRQTEPSDSVPDGFPEAYGYPGFIRKIYDLAPSK